MSNSPLTLLLGSVILGIWAVLSPDGWFRVAGLAVAAITGLTAIVLAFRAQRRAAERRAKDAAS